MAAIAVALSAYASHAAQGAAQSRLQTAAIMAFGHGLALVVLAPARLRTTRAALASPTHGGPAIAANRTLSRLALCAMYLGVLLFSGSLVGNVLAQWPTMLAPLGGMLLIAGWLALAIDLARG